MQDLLKNTPSMLVSLVLHSAILIVMFLIPVLVPDTADSLIESIMTQDIPRDQMEERLEIETDPADTLNVIAGGTLSSTVGASSQPASTPMDVQKANVLQEAVVEAPRVEALQLSDEVLAESLGDGVVTGEVGAVVEGYGAAMGVVTQELVRMMRNQKVTVVWLFDESQSTEDDRDEIRANVERVYEELGIASQQDKKLRRLDQPLLTSVASYGSKVNLHTPSPTADLKQIQAAIAAVPNDPSGEEKMCTALTAVIRSHQRAAFKTKRKLAIILLSDESGDDGDRVEEAVAAAKDANAPVYVMGRESSFGYPYASVRWTYEDKAKGINESFWLQIRRGPETAFPEALQWNGLRARWDSQPAGFGPYEQVRLARETGGIFFVLPGDEANLAGEAETSKRKYEFMALRQYRPVLLSRREYFEQRSQSPFRNTLWEVISTLNPNRNTLLFQAHDDKLNIKREHYPLAMAEFKQEAAQEVEKAVRSGQLIGNAIQMLDEIQPLRASEASPRWRAGYDLAYAQLHMFRLRLFQFMLSMDQHVNKTPKPGNADANEWNFRRNRSRNLKPDEQQFDRLKTTFGLTMSREEYIAQIADEEKRAMKLLKDVIAEHPGTPWAIRAEKEISDGFGYIVFDRRWDPSGARRNITLPKL